MLYRLSKNVELVEREEGVFLVSKRPLALLRLNESLARLVRPGLEGTITPTSEAEATVLEQLATKGFAERLREASELSGVPPEISIIIPVLDREDELCRCLASIARIDYPQEKLQVIVVDDGSADGSADVARESGATVISSGGRRRGPAAARNVGARKATGDILAFIDSDCTASVRWLAELVPAFADPDTAAVGGFVDGMCMDSAVDRYEAVMSSLSLGSRERSGNGGNDTFYLPSCNLLVRRTAFIAADGFDDGMHVGEDVDLTWRLRDAGWTICYLPEGRVFHEHRSSLRSFMSRRFDYGTSEGMLQLLHPRRRKQMVIPFMLALLLAFCAIAPFVDWWPILPGVALLAADAGATWIRTRRRGIPVGVGALVAGRLRALGSLVYYLSYHLLRYYAVPLLLLSAALPALALFLAGLLLCAAGVDYSIRKPRLSFPAYAGVYLLEQLAYGSGVFWGCLSRKTFASYRVVLLRQIEVAA